MDKVQIERRVGERVRVAAERAIVEAIEELNAAGHSFESSGNGLIDWREPGNDHQLSVFCTVGVSYGQPAVVTGPSSPEDERFLSRVQSGRDRTATLLNQLEGGISNGGLYQTIENQGVEFLDECAELLRAIGARASVRIVETAAGAWREHQAALEGYAALRKQLARLDRRFWALKESIPALYERTHSSA